jgi:Leucine-rich repeat (LRR) protein
MGTFGNGPFDNDAGMDLVVSIVSKDKAEMLMKPLQYALKAKKGCLEEWPAQEAVAAAELITILCGNNKSRLSPTLRDWQQTSKLEVTPSLLESAERALLRVLSDSELSELWQEGGDKEWKKFQKEIINLISRIKKPPETIKKKIVVGDEKSGRKAMAVLRKKGFYFAGPSGRPTIATSDGRGSRLTEEDCQYLASLTSLKDLSIRSYKIGASGLIHLQNLTNLEELSLEKITGVEEAADFLRSLKKLKKLNAAESNFGNKALAAIAGLVKLKSLKLSKCPITSPGLSHLTGLKNLSNINLSDTKITIGLQSLAKLPNLKVINFWGTKVSAKGFKELSSSSSIEQVIIDGDDVTDEIVHSLTLISTLKQLYLSGAKISDKACQSIAANTSLQNLNLYDTKITDRGCEWLSKNSSVELLKISGPNITTKSLGILAKMPQLKFIFVADLTLSTDEELSHLLKFKHDICIFPIGSSISIDFQWKLKQHGWQVMEVNNSGISNVFLSYGKPRSIRMVDVGRLINIKHKPTKY